MAIDAGVTGVNTFRQSSRSLANTTQMVRDIDEDQAKLETSAEAEVSSAAVHQIASVSTGIPNVLLESNLFVNWVQTDLILAWRYAVDDHVVDKITAASIPTGGGGSIGSKTSLQPGGRCGCGLLRDARRRLAGGRARDPVAASDRWRLVPLQPVGASTDRDADRQRWRRLRVRPLGVGSVVPLPFTLKPSRTKQVRRTRAQSGAESHDLFVVQRPDAAATLSSS